MASGGVELYIRRKDKIRYRKIVGVSDKIDRKVYFGELAFFHNGGFVDFEPDEWNDKFGDLINIE